MGSECWVPSRIQPPTMNKEQEFSAEQDEEKLILRRLRNSIDDLQRGYRRLDYQMTRVMTKSDRAKETRENIELIEDKVCIRGQPVPFRAYIPKEEVIMYRKDQKAGCGRLIYKGCKLNNRTMHNFRPTIGQFVQLYDVCYATTVA